MQTQTVLENTDYSVTVPSKDRSGARFVFTVGDLISPKDKAANPQYALGGLIRPNALTLKYKNGYIARCEITPLRQQMESEQTAFFNPSERKHLIPSYQVTQKNAFGEFEQKTVGGDGLLRVPFYPSDEVMRIANQGDGIVEMPVSNNQEKERAQYFLFENWDEIKSGAATFPDQIAKLRKYFTNRFNAARDEFEKKVAAAAIRSCDDYTSWGNIEINSANAQYEQAKVKGWAWSYGGDAEMLFGQLGVVRRDNLAQAQAEKIDTLTDVLAKQTELSNRFMEFQMQQAQAAQQQTQSPAPPPTVTPPSEEEAVESPKKKKGK